MSTFPIVDKTKMHERVHHDFTYHAPTVDQIERMKTIRQHAGDLAHIIVENCPLGREASTALTLLEQVSMMANAAIAREQNYHG